MRCGELVAILKYLPLPDCCVLIGWLYSLCGALAALGKNPDNENRREFGNRKDTFPNPNTMPVIVSAHFPTSQRLMKNHIAAKFETTVGLIVRFTALHPCNDFRGYRSRSSLRACNVAIVCL